MEQLQCHKKTYTESQFCILEKYGGVERSLWLGRPAYLEVTAHIPLGWEVYPFMACPGQDLSLANDGAERSEKTPPYQQLGWTREKQTPSTVENKE